MNRRVVLLGLAGALAVVVLWYFLLWKPQSDRLDRAKARQEAAATENRRLRLQKAKLEESGSNRPELEARLNSLEVAIPDAPNLAEFILDTNDAAAQSGIDVISITPSPPTAEGSGTPSMSVTLDITGGYFQVIDFVRRLDQLPRILVIDRLAITADESTSAGPPQLSASIGGRLFLTTLEAAPPAETATTTTTSTTSTTLAGSAPPSTSTTEAP